MKKSLFVSLLVLCGVVAARGQNNLPTQPYGPDEMVSLNPNVPLPTALEILSGFARKFENRVIVDAKAPNKPIGVSVENMHWKRALEYVLRSNMLRYEPHEQYYEVLEMVPGQAAAAEPKQAQEDDISIDTREIEINAIFFQADYETLHELGINWSTFKNGTVQFQTFSADEVAKDILRVSAGGSIRGAVNVNALLRAFESRSLGEIIARPKIRVMDGEKGKIKVGKNFYLTLQDFAGNTRFSEYESGIILTVAPTLHGRNDSTFIYLDLTAERSDVQPDAIGVTKSITEGQTHVLLLDGEETVMAGLLSHERLKVRKGVPLLKDIPILGYLFGYNSHRLRKKELVILLEARIVPPLLGRRGRQVDVREQLKRDWQELLRQAPEKDDLRGTKKNPAREPRRSPQSNRLK
ncbi:MAG: type II and III secretion system protein [candidate division KSB1 bacterium]|nr:type II and III secretion system protein [candidate division KSB1 bacterium]MDZ7273684.1 type II and III secretion system protein [candidate division KSB1 bacterium]MDZ7285840.1 type II and III secretion system protein [candidate division KSB1 bacterium]MDZ7298872.1 type II and III secretion system protein [candidate division KSB1 bacterium]MDZ7307082.1 type II and III secretion system protein [candidate division KSB1 bacterium]